MYIFFIKTKEKFYYFLQKYDMILIGKGGISMISKRIQKAMEGNSAIRAMFVEGKALAAKYGADLVHTLPAIGEGETGPSTLIKARPVALTDAGVPLVL